MQIFISFIFYWRVAKMALMAFFFSNCLMLDEKEFNDFFTKKFGIVSWFLKWTNIGHIDKRDQKHIWRLTLITIESINDHHCGHTTNTYPYPRVPILGYQIS